jgi:hypothetical protein
MFVLGAGGFLEFTFKFAAKELFGIDVKTVEFKPSKKPDFRIAVVVFFLFFFFFLVLFVYYLFGLFCLILFTLLYFILC